MKKAHSKSKKKSLPIDGKAKSSQAPETPKDSLVLRGGNLFLGYVSKNPKTAEQKAVLTSLQNDPRAYAVRNDEIVFPADPLATVLLSTTTMGTAPPPAQRSKKVRKGT
jgi:hypothetical protein